MTLERDGKLRPHPLQRRQQRPSRLWSGDKVVSGGLTELLGRDRVTTIDPFDRVQLEYVVEVCRRSASLSDAGRKLFAASREQRTSTNDADRLRKYLAKFGLDWSSI